MYKFILILVGLYLDGFVYMMQVGATIRDCGMGKRARYSLIYTLVARKLFHIAVVTNIDTLVLGASFSFMGSGALNALLLFLVFGFIAVYTALTIGYNLGASYQRQVSMSGGVLMIIFAVWVLIEYVL